MLKRVLAMILLLVLTITQVFVTTSITADAAETSVMKVNGRFLYDPRGDKIVIRGVENIFGVGLSQDGSYIDEAAQTGANAIRILPDLGGLGELTLSEVENLIQKAIGHGMVVYITPKDVANNVDWFIRSDVKAMLDKYSKYLILDAVGESTQSTDAEWVTDAVSAIQTMRNAGYKNPLCIISRVFGRQPHTILNNAEYVLDQDPERNIIFGVQMYWTDWYVSNYGMTVEQACQTFAAQDFMIQVGVCAGNREIGAGAYDYPKVMEYCHLNELSWLYWDWYNPFGPTDSMTTDGIYGHWRSRDTHPYKTNYGEWVAVASPYSIQNTAVKTPFLLGLPDSGGTGTGLKGEYFDNMDFTNLKVTRTDATVNFDWVDGSPDPSIGVDTFSVRWTGQVQPQYSQTYTFYTNTDDGVRLWVNNQLIIDKWVDHAVIEYSGSITLTAGQKYDIKMEYYDNGGKAAAKLLWSSSSQAKQVIPMSQLYPAGATGTLMAYDSLTASTGALHNITSGTGWASAWKVQNNNIVIPGYNISNSSMMSYSNLKTSGNYAIGGREYLTAAHTLDTTSAGPFADYLANGSIGASGKTLWVSFLLRKDDNTDAGNWVLLHNETSSTYTLTPLVGAGYFGADSNSGGTRYWTLQIGSTYYRTSVPVTVGQTALLVLRLDFGSTNTVKLYVNPTSLGGSAPSTASASATTTTNIAFKHAAYRGGSSTNQSSLDELRFGDTYGIVTPVQ